MTLSYTGSVVFAELAPVESRGCEPFRASLMGRTQQMPDDFPLVSRAILVVDVCFCAGSWIYLSERVLNSKKKSTACSTGRHAFCNGATCSAVRKVGALSDLDNISVRIADVAARLAVLGDRLRDEFRSSSFP